MVFFSLFREKGILRMKQVNKNWFFVGHNSPLSLLLSLIRCLSSLLLSVYQPQVIRMGQSPRKLQRLWEVCIRNQGQRLICIFCHLTVNHHNFWKQLEATHQGMLIKNWRELHPRYGRGWVTTVTCKGEWTKNNWSKLQNATESMTAWA